MLLRQLNKKKKSLITQFSAATMAEHLDFRERFDQDHARMDGNGADVAFQALCLKYQAVRPGSYREVQSMDLHPFDLQRSHYIGPKIYNLAC
jgi:hypothetical protein